MWHDAKGLQQVMEESLKGITSANGIKNTARDTAFLVRETKQKRMLKEELEELYPDVMSDIDESE